MGHRTEAAELSRELGPPGAGRVSRDPRPRSAPLPPWGLTGGEPQSRDTLLSDFCAPSLGETKFLGSEYQAWGTLSQ